jgi:paraquat-inducible protein B
MSSIFILKEILDLLYEESKRGELVTTDVENRLRNLEKQLEEKNKELSRLYTENIRLENTIKRYETEFELLSSMPIIPFENSVESDKPNKTENSSTESEKTENSSKTEKESVAESEETEEERKRKRREYLTEYQRKYRKAKREQKTELNV